MYQVNLGNDLLLTFALVQEAGQAINLTEAQDLAVTLKHETCSVTLNPAYIINEAGALQIEFNAPDQRLGVWALSVEGNLRDTRFADGLRAFRKDIYPAVKVLASDQPASNPPETLTAVLSAIVRGPQGIPGTPGDPTELLETLSQQQTQQIGEVAARLSSEQANALALQSDRLSREQADALDQQAERLSSEQRQQVANSMGNIYSEQENKLEDMRLKNQEAVDSLATLRQEQSQFLFDFSQEQQQKVDNALERIPSSINTEVDRHRPQIKDGYWWVGDEYTGVLAEAKRLSTEEWLILNKLSVYRAVVANYIIQGGDYGPQDVYDLYQKKREPHSGANIWYNQALVGRDTGHDTRMAFLVNDLSQYGDNILIRLSIDINGGAVAMYWLEGEQWASVSDANVYKGQYERGIMTLSASISAPSGPLIIITNSPSWGIFGRIDLMDIYSTSENQIEAPVVTWLGKPRNPSKGDVILVSNIASRGERIRLEYDGTDWALPWGAVIRGNSTNDARQSYTQAILSRLLRPEPIR